MLLNTYQMSRNCRLPPLKIVDVLILKLGAQNHGLMDIKRVLEKNKCPHLPPVWAAARAWAGLSTSLHLGYLKREIHPQLSLRIHRCDDYPLGSRTACCRKNEPHIHVVEKKIFGM